MAPCRACKAELQEGARFCAACGAPVRAAPAGDERKLATVLFADLVGSTALGESSDPERTRALLDRFYDAMAEEIGSVGGTVEKFVGDAVMAAFGAPAAQEDHAERALHAALSMQHRLRELFGDDLRLRIGVNTGEVVVGRPREGSSFVTGDAVNVAARLEQAAEPGAILVGERTAAAVHGAFELGEPFALDAKGKAEPVVARELRRALSLMRPRGVRGLGLVFVGREVELELLQATYRRAVGQQEPHLVTVMGEAGVGKTTLVRELWRWLADQEPQPSQRTGRCVPYGQSAYWPLAEVLKEHLGILDSDPPDVARARLGPREILGLTLGLDVSGELHPLAARDRLHEAWVEFLGELTAERPAVVLVEDLHWAEEVLLDLLERVVRDVRGPLLLVCTARPDFHDRRPAWGAGRRNAQTLWLDALANDEARAMLAALLAAPLPEGLADAIVASAEGNPFFVEELVGQLIDSGVLTHGDAGWEVGELPQGFAVPDSVQSILAARIDLLGPADKAGLQAAAVVGRIFWKEPVCDLLDGVEPDCDLLEDRDFIRRRAGSSLAGEEEYAFKHALTREVAYSSLPKARRAELHARFADWLERTQGGHDEHAFALAHHLASAAAPDIADLAWGGREADLAALRAKAVHWLRRGGELAIKRYDLDTAIDLLGRAVELTDDVAERSEIWRRIGTANAYRFDGEAFWTAMQRSLEICTDRAICGEAYAELAYQTASRSGMWRTQPDRELVQEWIDSALELAAPETPARAKALLAKAYWSDDGDEAAAAALEASALAERVGSAELRSDGFGARSMVAFDAAAYDEALTFAQRALDLMPEVQDPGFAADLAGFPTMQVLAVGRLSEARRLAAEADERGVALTPHHRVHGVSYVAEVEEALGEWDVIRGLSDRVRDAVEQNLDTPCVRNARSLLVCAHALAELGDHAAAETLEREAAALGISGYVRAMFAPRARLAIARGEAEALAPLLEEANGTPPHWFALAFWSARLDVLAALGRADAVEEEAGARRSTFLEPFVLRARGVVRGDEALVREAHEAFRELGLEGHIARTDLLRALSTRA